MGMRMPHSGWAASSSSGRPCVSLPKTRKSPARKSASTWDFRAGDFLVFGKETQGLPEELLNAHPECGIRIPIFSSLVRSLNLSTAAGIILYEALRQTGRLDG